MPLADVPRLAPEPAGREEEEEEEEEEGDATRVWHIAVAVADAFPAGRQRLQTDERTLVS